MAEVSESESRKLLVALRDTMADSTAGQERLNQIVTLTAQSVGSEVCSIYLFRDAETLELCATQGLNQAAVHQTRLRVGEGLVGRVARKFKVVNTANAPDERGFRYMAETGEELFPSFLGVPIQRLGRTVGVLVLQSKEARKFTDDEVYAVEVVAMVLAEMAELGALVGDENSLKAQHLDAVTLRGGTGQEGLADGHVYLHEPRVVVTNFVSDDPDHEKQRLEDALENLRIGVDQILANTRTKDEDQIQVLEAYRLFANSKGWRKRMIEDIDRGMTAEAAVEKEQSAARQRMSQVNDAYLRERLHDLDDISNKLLRLLTGQGRNTGAEMPEKPILVAQNIGPGELLEYGRKIRGVVLEEGSVGSHAAIVARALAIPLVIHAQGIVAEALNGDAIMVDGDQGIVHLRPEDSVQSAFRDKIIMNRQAATRYADLVDKPATSMDGQTVSLHMNAGLMADLPSLVSSGAEGVGLFRTELQFLTQKKMPRRQELSTQYANVMDAAGGKRVVFRTLDIGSDKVLPYMKPQDEPNPAMGWRAIRVGLDKPGVMRMQIQALLRAANGRALSIMFPFIAQFHEYRAARAELEKTVERERVLGHVLPADIQVGAMLETPSLAFAPQQFFDEVDFISIGGNDLKQFFYAADRENERVRKRYDTLNTSFLSLIEMVVQRCALANTPLSFCGEDAGRPLEAACFAAMGLQALSMRPASIGPVKDILRRTNLAELRNVIDHERTTGAQSVRGAVREFLMW